jgi:hypothetical protein
MPSGATFETTQVGTNGRLPPSFLGERLRLLAQADSVEEHNRVEWAQLCLREGAPAAARLLFEVAFLQQGFSPQLLAVQDRIASETGLWPPEVEADALPPSDTGTVEIAIGEIRGLARALCRQFSRPTAGHWSDNGVASSKVRSPEPALTDVGSDDLHAPVHALYLALRRATETRCVADVETAVALLFDAAGHSALVDIRTFGAASLPLLGAAIGFAGVCEFVTSNRDLIRGAYGSPELLHRTARLNSGGLGPYLGNVQRIVRKSRDVFELAYLARDAAEGEGVSTGVEPWVALLSRRLGGPLLDEVIDDLGDLDARVALTMIYDRAANLPDNRIDLRLIRRLRDVALDNLDYDLAAQAQALIVRLRPDMLLERIILGDIDGTAGRLAAAEQSFLACLHVTPTDQHVARRLAAIRSRSFHPFEVRRGFGSPEGRQVARLHRRERAPRP